MTQIIDQLPNAVLTCGFKYVPIRYIKLYIVLKNSLQASMFPAYIEREKLEELHEKYKEENT
jgi:hypothetical protein